jgi:integrase
MKAETARKAINRLSICMEHAAALGLDVDLQACDKAKALLGTSRHKAENIPAMLWAEVPAFYAGLCDGTVTHLALRLLILTGVRSGPLRHLHESQLAGDIWTIPGEAMKGRKGATSDFRVPLVPEALDLIEQAQRHARGGYLFPSTQRGVISDMTMAMLMQRRGLRERPHGLRSSLRNWIAETLPGTPHEVAEACLGHVTDSKGRCCGTRVEAGFTPFPSGSGDAHDLGPAKGREAVHQGDTGVDLGGLAIGVS